MIPNKCVYLKLGKFVAENIFLIINWTLHKRFDRSDSMFYQIIKLDEGHIFRKFETDHILIKKVIKQFRNCNF